jgi:hypothetical protein
MIDASKLSLTEVLEKLGYDVEDSTHSRKLILKDGERRCYGRANDETGQVAPFSTWNDSERVGRTHMGIATPQEYREAEERLRAYQERLCREANEMLEKIETGSK